MRDLLAKEGPRMRLFTRGRDFQSTSEHIRTLQQRLLRS